MGSPPDILHIAPAAQCPWLYLLVVLAGIVSGFVNTLAGSGSLITLPLLIFMGLPAPVANGTNRIGILMQSAAAAWAFRRQGLLAWRSSVGLTLTAVLGAIAGALLAVNLSEELMNRAIGLLLLVMLVVMIYRPERWLRGQGEGQARKPSIGLLAVFAAIGFYGGFIQAGVGFFLLAGLVLGAGFDVVRANALKVLITLMFTIFALLIFIVNHQVHYLLGLLLGVGSMVGAWMGTRMAVRRGAAFIRWVLLVAIGLSAAKLLLG